jgi:hypothetical protein
MMDKMGGVCEVSSHDSSYMIKIKFPVKLRIIALSDGNIIPQN